MTTDDTAERVSEALLAPLLEVGRMLATEIDKLSARVDAVEARQNEADAANVRPIKGSKS